jgi:hypothetical protein
MNPKKTISLIDQISARPAKLESAIGIKLALSFPIPDPETKEEGDITID